MYNNEEYYYEFSEQLTEEIAMTVLGIVGVVLLVVLLFAVVGYVFQSLSLYTIAKRRGIRNPWLAWIPWVAPYWITGSISDQYHYVTRGDVKNRRFIMLVLVIVSMVLNGVTNAFSVAQSLETLEYIAGENLGYRVAAVSGVGILGLVNVGVSLALLVFWHMSLFDVYNSCDPRSSTAFLVLGIFLGFLIPFFLFACRKKDYGMPPRRENPQPEHRYREPWEN